MSEEFVIHPGKPGDVAGLSIDLDGSLSPQPGERYVVRGVARAFRFLAYTVFAVDHKWLLRMQGEGKRKVFVSGAQFLILAVPLHRPVAVPDALPASINSGNSRASAVDPLDVVKPSSVQVAQSEMREVNVPDIPCRGFRGIAAHSLTEEGQLKTVTVSVSRGEVPGVIPPFRLVIRVVKVIAGELVMVTRQGCLEFPRARL